MEFLPEKALLPTTRCGVTYGTCFNRSLRSLTSQKGHLGGYPEQHLAAIRHFFEGLVTRHAMISITPNFVPGRSTAPTARGRAALSRRRRTSIRKTSGVLRKANPTVALKQPQTQK